MKKTLCILLAVLMIVGLFSGCAGEPGPLRICIDLDQFGNTPMSVVLEDLKWWVEKATGLEKENIVFEIIPDDDAERDTAIDRIRTEIMSGEGPDVFIVQCDSWYKTLLFQMPEKAVELDLFLPLDEYIETAEYAEWDKFTQSVMAAGRDEEGQQLVPLTYLLPVAMYRASDVSHTPQNMTWDEMRNTEELQDAAARLGAGLTSRGLEYDFPIEYLLGELADYQKEELLFTEEELLAHTKEILEYTKDYHENKLYETPYKTKTCLGVRFNWHGAVAYGVDNDDQNGSGGRLNSLTEFDRLTLVPSYSDDGGCTAMITSFAAVNRNTRRPEEAFKVLDMLMMTDRQANGTIFHQFVYRKNDYAGMPMHEEVMSSKYEMRGTQGVNKWFSLDNENFSTVCAVRDQITAAQFSGSLNTALENMMGDCYSAYRNGEDYTPIVHETYAALRQMIAE